MSLVDLIYKKGKKVELTPEESKKYYRTICELESVLTVPYNVADLDMDYIAKLYMDLEIVKQWIKDHNPDADLSEPKGLLVGRLKYNVKQFKGIILGEILVDLAVGAWAYFNGAPLLTAISTVDILRKGYSMSKNWKEKFYRNSCLYKYLTKNGAEGVEKFFDNIEEFPEYPCSDDLSLRSQIINTLSSAIFLAGYGELIAYGGLINYAIGGALGLLTLSSISKYNYNYAKTKEFLKKLTKSKSKKN